MGSNLYSFLEKKSIRAETLENHESMEVLGVSNKVGITVTDHKKSKDLSKYQLIEEGDFAYNPYRINVGSIGLVPKGVKGLVSPAYVVFQAKSTLLPELLFEFLKSNEGLFQIGKYARGTVRKALRFEDLCKIEMPIPTIEIQHAILKKKESVELENNELKSELTHQQTLLKKLRQQILQEAIEGKLTEGWRANNPDVEPASELLERIQAEKAQQIKDKKIKKQKPLPPISEDEKPFALPDGWVWCRYGNVMLDIEAGKSPACFNYPAQRNEWGVLKISAISWDLFRENENKKLKPNIEPFTDKEVKIGDFIMTRANTKELVAKSVIVNSVRSKLLLNDKTLRVKFSVNVSLDYMNLFNNGKHSRSHYLSVATGASPSMKNISRDNIKILSLPLPPLPEQKAIVTKVEKLLALCDQLESQITRNQTHANALMQAVLKEAFTSNKGQTNNQIEQATTHAE